MELFRRRSAWQRNNIVMRLGCFLVSASMLVSLVLQPPKAKAIVAEASLATSVIWAFMQSAGITFNGPKALSRISGNLRKRQIRLLSPSGIGSAMKTARLISSRP